MDHYRISVGMVSPKRALRRRSMSHSAKSLPGSMPSFSRRGALSGRAPSAPPIPRTSNLSTKVGSQNVTSPIRSHSSAGARSPKLRHLDGDANNKLVSLEVPQDGVHSTAQLNAASIASG